MGDDDQRPVLVAIGPHADIDAVLDAAEAERRRRVLRLVHVIARADAAEAGGLRLFCAPDAEIAGPGRDGASWAAHVDTVVRGRLGGVLEEQPEVDVEVAPWHGHLGPKVPRLLREVACPVLVVDPVEPVEPAGHPSTGAGRVQQREKR